MTTALAPQLSDSLQELIELRLDTLDRTLLGRIRRGERINIVSEVEAQIFELLAQRETEELGRDDVLAILSQLDPPEAYVPDEPQERDAARRERPARTATPAGPATPAMAKAAGILGVSALSMILFAPVVFLAATVTESAALCMGVLLLAAFFMLVGGVLGIVFSLCSRLRGAWAVAGLVTGSLAVLVSLCGGLMLALEMFH